MRGLIYGDVRGSIYEWKPVAEQASIKEPLRFTDDTVLGAAVADALVTCWEQGIEDEDGIVQRVAQKLREYGLRYLDAGYSRSFRNWLSSDEPKPYGSKTNGAIMRCTSAGWLARSPQEARRLGRLTAMPTHDHPEALEAAAFTAEIIYRLRMGESVDQMYALLSEHYKIPTLDEIRPITEFDFTCKTTLPIAFAAFYEAVVEHNYNIKYGNMGKRIVSYAAENAISLGGDTDTNAAIAAAFAEAWNFAWGFAQRDMPCHGKPLWYAETWGETERYCTPDILSVLDRLDAAVAKISPLRECGDYVYRVNERGEAVIVKYRKRFEPSRVNVMRHSHSASNVIEVPKALGGCPVTAIGPFAFDYSTEGIPCRCRVPEGVRIIGDYAFVNAADCVFLPDSVEVIGSCAFASSENNGGNFPKKLRILGAGAFDMAKGIPCLYENMDLQYIGKRAMRGWSGGIRLDTRRCVIPKSVKRMDPQAMDTKDTAFWVYRDSCGEAFCRQNGCEYYYLDEDIVDRERARWQDKLDRIVAERIRESEKKRQRADAAKARQKAAEDDQYEWVEISVARYAGWREHYPSPYYYMDQDERVFKRVPKKK